MDSFIGIILQFAGDYAPVGWMLCNGDTLTIQHHEALYSILGTKYGGDPTHNFKLPNLNVAGGPTYIICVEGLYPSRS